MARSLPKASIGCNSRGWFIFDVDSLRTLTQHFGSRQDAIDEFEEYEDQRWTFGSYWPFYRD